MVKFSDVRHLPKLIRHFAYYRRVLKAAREADAILALDPVSVGFPAMKAAKRAGKPFVVKIVGDYAWEQGRQRFGIVADLDTFVRTKTVPFPVGALRWIQTRVAKNAVRVIVPSTYLKDVTAIWGIPAEKIEVIYNAMQSEKPGRVHESVAALSRPLVVSVGRLVPWKGMLGTIDAVAAVSESVPSVSLAIVGDGPEHANIGTHAKKLGSRAVLTGRLSHADTLTVMESADAFVLNTSYEGLSHLLIEALALGVPVVTTDVGGNGELIRNGENGLLAPPGDADALVEALRRILSDKELAARLSREARESAKRFSVEALIPRTATFLKSLV